MLFWCCTGRKTDKNLKPDEKFVKLSAENKWKLHKEKNLYLAEFGLNKGFFYVYLYQKRYFIVSN